MCSAGSSRVEFSSVSVVNDSAPLWVIFPASAAVDRYGGGVCSTARVQLSSWGKQIYGSGVIPEIMSGTRGAAEDKTLSEVEGRSQQQYGKYEFPLYLQV